MLYIKYLFDKKTYRKFVAPDVHLVYRNGSVLESNDIDDNLHLGDTFYFSKYFYVPHLIISLLSSCYCKHTHIYLWVYNTWY